MNTYCDNDSLKERIENSTPCKDGLYEHEIAILIPAYQGGATTQGFYGEGNLHFTYLIDYPQELAESMVSRGYLRLSTDEELVDCLRTFELRELLKRRGIKPGKSRKSALEKVRDNISHEEVVAEIPYRFYLLTDEGKRVLEENAKFETMPNGREVIEVCLQSNPSSSKADRKMLSEATSEYKSGVFAIRRNTRVNWWLWEESPITNGKEVWGAVRSNYETPITIELRHENGSITTFDYVSRILFLRNKKVILFGTKPDGNTFEVQCFTEKDNEELPQPERLNLTDLRVLPRTPSLEERSVNKKEDIRADGWHLFFSAANEVGNLLITNVIKEFGVLTQHSNIMADDTSANYELVISEDDTDTFHYILFLMRHGLLDYPRVLEMPVAYLLDILKYKEERPGHAPIVQLYEDDWYKGLIDALGIIDKSETIVARLGGINQSFKVITQWLPSKMLYRDAYSHSIVEENGRLQNKNNYGLVLRNKDRYENRLSEDIFRLKETGQISTRWKNEFNLYLEIKKHFDDAVYQYRSSWLGMQSLDIFIPSIQTGIEYQGLQHYQPVDFFGGEDSLAEQQERDKRKKSLCKANSVRLIEWPYEQAITSAEVRMFVEQIKNET